MIQNITTFMKQRRMNFAGQVTHVEVMRIAYKILVLNFSVKDTWQS